MYQALEFVNGEGVRRYQYSDTVMFKLYYFVMVRSAPAITAEWISSKCLNSVGRLERHENQKARDKMMLMNIIRT
jgi:hypothetical protein